MYFFHKIFSLAVLTYLHFLDCPQHYLTILGKRLFACVSVCDKHFMTSGKQKLTCRIPLNLIFNLTLT